MGPWAHVAMRPCAHGRTLREGNRVAQVGKLGSWVSRCMSPWAHAAMPPCNPGPMAPWGHGPYVTTTSFFVLVRILAVGY